MPSVESLHLKGKAYEFGKSQGGLTGVTIDGQVITVSHKDSTKQLTVPDDNHILELVSQAISQLDGDRLGY